MARRTGLFALHSSFSRQFNHGACGNLLADADERDSLMALVFGRLLVALILAACFVAAIAPRVAPAADVTAILDQATSSSCA
jgi:hypothetical protein